MKLDLSEKIAVVTGGASGIGRATAESFAGEGCSVAIWDLSEAAAQTAGEIAEATGTSVIARQVDVTRQDQIDAALKATEESLGPVDHLVHAAAIGSGKFGFPFLNLEVDDWTKVIEVNVLGMTRIAHAIAPGMVERKRGTLTFIASVAGQIGSQTDPAYSASKAANINFAQCMAKDLAKHGVRVNTVCPGMVQTPLNKAVWQAWHDRQPEGERLDYEAWAGEKIRTVVPLGRWQQPSDIASMVVFLASERASQVTGQTINVDGGFVMHS
jgi:2-hydroxycyclohexanecarboxyl-CoA dehydrogenase